MIINVGLIGLGKIGALYDIDNNNLMSHLKTIINDKRFNLQFAYDPNDDVCNVIRNKYNLSSIYSSIKDIKKLSPKIDLLIIASPTSFHLESIELMVDFTNPIFLLCEKPLALNIVDSNKIKDICSERGIKVVSNFMRRSLPAFQELKRRLNKNTKTINDVVIKYSGCFKNNGSHFIDLMSYLYGDILDYSLSFNEVDEDSIHRVGVSIKFQNSICTFVPLHSNKVIDHEILIMSEQYKYIISRAGREMKIYSPVTDPDFINSKEYANPKNIRSDYLNFQKYVYNDIFDSINSGSVALNLCGIDASIKNIKIIEDIINDK